MNKRRQYFQIKNKFKRDNTELNKNKLKSECKLYRKLISKKSSLFYKDFHAKLRSLKSKYPKDYLNLLNNKRSKKIDSVHINDLYEHFRILKNKVINEDENIFTEKSIEYLDSSELDCEFTMEELNRQIVKLKNYKANGFDNIINEFIKYSPIKTRNALLLFFNKILSSGIVPSEWGISIIQPIYKNSGLKSSADNYRGISLISCTCKLFTALLNDRLSNFVENNNILGEEQAGFRQGYSTTDHLLVLNSIIDLYLNMIKRKKRLFCAFVDFKKAFDLVDRNLLWIKLMSYDINGKFLKVMFNMYQQTKECIKLNNIISPSFMSNIGVRQGDHISPLFFSLFLNDCIDFLHEKYKGLDSIDTLVKNSFEGENLEILFKIYILLYADDTIVLAESVRELQIALNALQDYCTFNKLEINYKKTKIIRFSKRRCKNIPVFKINDKNIEVVESYVYLGSSINFNGNFHVAIKKQIVQAKRALFALKSKREKFKLPIDIYLNLFDTMVMPILLYGCEIWGYSNITKIEIFYKDFLKSTLKLNTQTPNCMVYGELGRKPIEITKKNENYKLLVKTSNSKRY